MTDIITTYDELDAAIEAADLRVTVARLEAENAALRAQFANASAA